MRRFEFVEGKSSKFWEVSASGSTVAVRFGRIGANGTAQEKTFADEVKAKAEADKLIREKVSKGYKEMNAGQVQAPAAPTPVSVQKSVRAAAPAAPEPAPKPQRSDASIKESVTAGIDVPKGEFLWTPSWSAIAPKFRGEDVGEPYLDRKALLTDIPLLKGQKNEYSSFLHQATMPQKTSQTWSVKETPEQLTPEKIESGDDAYWRTLFATAAELRRYTTGLNAMSIRGQLDWAVRVCTVLKGLPAATSYYLETLLGPGAPQNSHRLMYEGAGVSALRELLAAASDKDYTASLELARSFADQSDHLKLLVAHAFPTESDLIDNALSVLERQPASSDPPGALLFSVRLTLRQAERLTKIGGAWTYVGSELTQIALLNCVRLHGAGALPLTVRVLDRLGVASMRKPVLPIIRAYDSPEAFAELIERVEEKDVRPLVDALALEYPALVLKLGAERARSMRSKSIEAWLIRTTAANQAHVPSVVAALNTETAEYLQSLAARTDVSGEEASPESVPEILRAPPWAAKKSKATPATERPALEQMAQPEEMVWPDGLKAGWAQHSADTAKSMLNWMRKDNPALSSAEAALLRLGIKVSEARTKILQGARPDETDYLKERYSYRMANLLLLLPDNIAIAVWETMPPADWYEHEAAFEDLAAKFELAFLPGLLRYIQTRPERGLELALPFRSASIAPLAADALRRTKKAKLPAQRWLMAHSEVAAVELLRYASGSVGTARDDAEHALRWLAANGRNDALEKAASRYGEAGKTVLTDVMSFDALSLYPRKLPKMPMFFVPGGFTRPRLKSGDALPIPAAENLGMMLAFSTLEARYAGLDLVAAACNSDSLAQFAWDLFIAWLQSGAPSKEQWAFLALAHLGTDETARRLSPLIRQWPGEAAHARAVLGLEVLAGIGSDVALMHLNGIAQKVKFKGLQERARERIAAIAEARGLTTEELADRLVPDLGLDENGTMVLDFGPRKFTVGFDEQLKPFVRDDSGKRIKDLPKPGKDDNAELSAQATDAYKALKKDARTLASQQIRRFERAMADRRRWSVSEFRLFLVEHPLLRHLTQRVLWSTYQEGKPVACFRVAEDLSFADKEDSAWSLPDDARVGIAHPLEIDASTAAAFGQVFADYEILQPFRQLGRETYALTADEQSKAELDRFKGKKVPTGSVYGLENKGWRRGEPQDAGWIGWFTRPLSNGLHIELGLDPGTVVGDISYEPVQKLESVVLRRDGTWHNEGLVPFSELDPILASEVLRDLDLLA